MADKESSDIQIIRRVILEARPFWPHVIGVFLLGLLATPLALLTPVPLMLAVDSVIGTDPLPRAVSVLLPAMIEDKRGYLLIALGVMIIVIAVLTQAQSLGTWLLQTYTGQKLSVSFKSRLFQHAQRLSLAYHDTKGSSDALYRIQYDATNLQHIMVTGLAPFVTSMFMLIGMIIVTALVDWQIALVALTVSPILFALTQVYRKRLRQKWNKVKVLESSALGIVQEVLGSLRVVKAFGQEDREKSRFSKRMEEGLNAQVSVVFEESTLGLLIGLTIAVGTASVLYIGVGHVQTGILTLGELLLVMAYLAQLYQPLRALGNQIAKMQGWLAGVDRSFQLLDTPADVAESPTARAVSRAKGDLEFRNVTFEYEAGRKVLEAVSFHIAAGTKVGLVGRTGSGKSTIVNLLLRFYDPDSGTVLLDGEDIRNLRIADLRNQFAIVMQEPVLLATTIAENISYADPAAEMEQIMAAARAANIHDFIEGLPEGYDTEVGDRGLKLSGGQRQRISLARAFLKDAPILILDEPTSSVDLQTEALILEAMKRLMQGRTSVMIAHRLNTLETCDYVLRLSDNGAELTSESMHVAQIGN